jgi:hypothetical protein
MRDMKMFDPWKGCNYEQSAPRILAVGESTYFGSLSSNEFHEQYERDRGDWFNKWLREKFITGEENAVYFTKLLNSLARSSPETTEEKLDLRKKGLNSIAFYNYFDVILEAVGRAVPREATTTAPEKFQGVMEALRPDLAIVTSFRVRDYMKKSSGFRFANREMIGRYEAAERTLGNHTALFLFLPHPRYAKLWKTEDIRSAVSDCLRGCSRDD